ncbi:MAG TPA: hypothetical protein VN840_09485, partial [Streptosporangiaceae bacterium]|nr:hypothetical protein [Streptosporangiaceae bacterium]
MPSDAPVWPGWPKDAARRMAVGSPERSSRPRARRVRKGWPGDRRRGAGWPGWVAGRRGCSAGSGVWRGRPGWVLSGWAAGWLGWVSGGVVRVAGLGGGAAGLLG